MPTLCMLDDHKLIVRVISAKVSFVRIIGMASFSSMSATTNSSNLSTSSLPTMQLYCQVTLLFQ